MRLTFLKSSLPIVLAATFISGQQGKSAPAQQPAQQSAAKQSSGLGAQAKSTHTTRAHHRVVRKRNGEGFASQGCKAGRVSS